MSKKEKLICPFSWQERRPKLQEGVLFIPAQFDHAIRGLDPEELAVWASYIDQSPLYVELCTGNGDWILQRAEQDRSIFWLAVEKRLDRCGKIWRKKRRQQISNLEIVCGTAEDFLAHYLPDDVVDHLFVNFPDPWPKPKHAKNRLFQIPFVANMAKKIKAGGLVTIVTDHQPWADEIAAHMLTTFADGALFSACYEAPHYVCDWDNYGGSFFKNLWQAKGKSIYYLKFVRDQKGQVS